MTHFWWSWVLPAALQATPLLLLAAGLDLLLPRLLDPRIRAGLWLIAAAKLVVPLRVAADLALLPVPVYEPPPLWTALLPAVWLAGALLLATGSALWYWRERSRLAPSAVDAEVRSLFDEARAQFRLHRARVVASNAIEGPMAIGRTVYWPAGLERHLTPEQISQVLRHELAHIARRDGWRELAWSAALALFWFHPLVWWAARRMRAIREQCCDRTASALPGHCADAYRDALLRVVRLVHLPAPGLALVDPRAPLAHRLALLRGSPRAHWRGMAALAAVAIVWPLVSQANRASSAVAEWVIRPPGSLQLRYMVIERLAQEKQK